MIQIVSDKQNNFINWLTEVVSRLEEYQSISRMVVVAETDVNDNEYKGKAHIIEFMNCNTDDIYYLGSLLQKEAIKHEITESLGIDDESWEEEE